MAELKDITIIIPTRANIEYLNEALQSILTKPQYQECKILVGVDNNQETYNWMKENYPNVETQLFKTENNERVGIVLMVEALIEKVETEFIFYMHDDMVIGNHTLKKLLANWSPKTILSSKRVEPPLYPEAPEKHVIDFGFDPETFQESKFLEFETFTMFQEARLIVEGFFAPHFFAKKDWIGYDKLFIPQSREDSDLAQKYLSLGYKLYTIAESIVYHFSGKGSRKKDGMRDSLEWQKTNYKNTKNYIRKWKTLRHTKYILPERAPDIPISVHILACDRDAEYVPRFLENTEPFFEEFVFVIDSPNQESVIEEIIKEYNIKQLSLQPTNFNPEKIKVFYRELKNDFSGQTNFAISKCSNEWTIKLDLDEEFDENFLNNIRFALYDIIKQNPNVTVVGFPRVNYLDGKVSNDIPRDHWFTEQFDMYPDNINQINNQDIQFRLHKKSVQWVGSVHELPKPVLEQDLERVSVVGGLFITHKKNRQRQFLQEQLYHQIQQPPVIKEPITKYVYDSVIFTHEGITKHAREEIKELLKRGKSITLLDQNYKAEFGDEFKNCYQPIELFHMPSSTTEKPTKQRYVTIVNQPPVRWKGSETLQNRIGYLAFEGQLNKEWVKIINESNIIELWTPSTYCKDMFEKSGVQKPIMVIPHGIDPNIWKPVDVTREDYKQLKDDKFMFLACGTFHNNRKGFDLLAKAFSEEFAGQDNVKLLFKVNKIYNPNEGFNKYITQYVNQTGNTSIEYIDDNLTDTDLRDLFALADCYVSPHRAEGFGINILNSLAVGTPVVATEYSGNMDFCNTKNTLFVENKGEVWAQWMPPYEESKWGNPSLESLKKQLRKAYEDSEALKKRGREKVSPKIQKEWSWNNVVDKMEARVKELLG